MLDDKRKLSNHLLVLTVSSLPTYPADDINVNSEDYVSSNDLCKESRESSNVSLFVLQVRQIDNMSSFCRT